MLVGGCWYEDFFEAVLSASFGSCSCRDLATGERQDTNDGKPVPLAQSSRSPKQSRTIFLAAAHHTLVLSEVSAQGYRWLKPPALGLVVSSDFEATNKLTLLLVRIEGGSEKGTGKRAVQVGIM